MTASIRRSCLTGSALISLIETSWCRPISSASSDWRACNWPNDDACWEKGTASVEQNLSATLDEIRALRGGKPTAIRVLTYPNMFIGALTSPQPPFLGDTAFQNFYAGQLDALNDAICRDADASGAACVDLVTAFNGPTGDVAPKGLIGPDNKHPTAAGHELIAKNPRRCRIQAPDLARHIITGLHAERPAGFTPDGIAALRTPLHCPVVLHCPAA